MTVEKLRELDRLRAGLAAIEDILGAANGTHTDLRKGAAVASAELARDRITYLEESHRMACEEAEKRAAALDRVRGVLAEVLDAESSSEETDGYGRALRIRETIMCRDLRARAEAEVRQGCAVWYAMRLATAEERITAGLEASDVR